MSTQTPPDWLDLRRKLSTRAKICKVRVHGQASPAKVGCIDTCLARRRFTTSFVPTSFGQSCDDGTFTNSNLL
ncbi:predicted protein [Botrytis cinerea T4]|uniref:Uncharacterized protein n=1 Tax=Botryotinia fuckeliana (strain T4) TaxID=999810 RepID=G2Y1K0_BOTF4|nr:predicted protein [Botrytis cinerea T4]